MASSARCIEIPRNRQTAPPSRADTECASFLPARAQILGGQGENDFLGRIFSFFSDASLTRVCRSFRLSLQMSEMLILWRNFCWEGHLAVHEIVQQEGGVPTTAIQIRNVYRRMVAATRHFMNPMPETPSSFSPLQIVSDCERSYQFENDMNLCLMMPGIVNELNRSRSIDHWLRAPLNANNARNFFRTHQGEIADIFSLDFSNIALTLIPREFVELPWPRLTSLCLDRNRLTTLPSGFLANNPHLTSLELSNNPITSLPAGFENRWRWWNDRRDHVLENTPLLLQMRRESEAAYEAEGIAWELRQIVTNGIPIAMDYLSRGRSVEETVRDLLRIFEHYRVPNLEQKIRVAVGRAQANHQRLAAEQSQAAASVKSPQS